MEVGQGPNWGCRAKEKKLRHIPDEIFTCNLCFRSKQKTVSHNTKQWGSEWSVVWQIGSKVSEESAAVTFRVAGKESSIFLRNMGTHLPEYTAPQPIIVTAVRIYNFTTGKLFFLCIIMISGD
jgi:hypothetical protein